MEFINIISINEEIDYNIYVNSSNKLIIKSIDTIFKNKTIIYNGIKRIGGNEHTYTDFCFEIHLFTKNKPNSEHEIVGGGNYNIIYKKNKILACGFSIGLERLMYYLTYSENQNRDQNIIYKLISQIKAYNLNSKKDIYINLKNTNIIDKILDIIQYNGIVNIKFIK